MNLQKILSTIAEECDLKSLESECSDQECGCHTSDQRLKVMRTREWHAEYNAYKFLDILAPLILESTEPIKRQGGGFEYDGVMNMLWERMCEIQGIEPILFEATYVKVDSHARKVASPYEDLRKRISAKTRLKIYKRDGYQCVVCGVSKDLTLDHVLALANGGTNDEDNLQTMCHSCNSKKGVKLWQLEGRPQN